jgi:UDP-glucuronate 4-epimerase
MANSTCILLTGGAGFIGSHLAEALLRNGAELSVVDNLNAFYPPNWKLRNLEDVSETGQFRFFKTDICDLELLRSAFTSTRPEIVIHLAAMAGVRPSIADPRAYEHVNVAGTLNVLEMCRAFGVRKFIFGSSSSVYGASCHVPFREDDFPLRPLSPYAATKVAGELLAYTYAHLYGMSAVCLRFFTVYGPRQRPDLAIHRFTALIEAGQPVPIFGDKEMSRDYTHVDDIVGGVLAATKYEPDPPDGVSFEVFNLGNSHPVTVSTLVDLLEDATGHTVIREFQPGQPGDMPSTWADISKSESCLGYRPKTPLKDGIASFVRWYRHSQGSNRLVLSQVA